MTEDAEVRLFFQVKAVWEASRAHLEGTAGTCMGHLKSSTRS